MLLRWILGLIGGFFIVGWLLLIAMANSFRGSFGASENPVWKIIGPVAVAILLTAAVIWPDRRLLLHAAAIAALGLLVGSLLLVRTTFFVASLGSIYAVLWFLFYKSNFK
jgi:hypothetical protein